LTIVYLDKESVGMSSSIKFGARAAAMLLSLAGAATPASADWLLTPYLGVTFGGNANFGDVGDFEDNFEKKVTFGATAAWMGAGIVGFEFDFGTTPNFFATTGGDSDFDFGDSNVTTFMGNLVLGAPIGGTSGPGVRPYGSGGIGLLRSNVSATGLFDDLNTSELGVNVGGGVHVFFNDNVGLRGDVRYFRGLQRGDDDEVDFDLEDFRFWRGTIGITFRLGN
jgi:opacity protein-like surface antigen